jgi:hypothetical protein
VPAHGGEGVGGGGGGQGAAAAGELQPQQRGGRGGGGGGGGGVRAEEIGGGGEEEDAAGNNLGGGRGGSCGGGVGGGWGDLPSFAPLPSLLNLHALLLHVLLFLVLLEFIFVRFLRVLRPALDQSGPVFTSIEAATSVGNAVVKQSAKGRSNLGGRTSAHEGQEDADPCRQDSKGVYLELRT